MSGGKRVGRLPVYLAVPVTLVAVFVLVATVVRAVSEDSWGPVWMNAWVPAILLASLYSPMTGRSCRSLLRGRTGS